MKNASNTFVPSTKEFVEKKINKMSWLKKTLLCMNVDIRKSQHEAYKTNREILKHLRGPQTQEQIEASEGTLSFNRWSKGTVNWADFADVTSKSSSSSARGKQPAVDESEEDSTEEGEEDSEEYST